MNWDERVNIRPGIDLFAQSGVTRKKESLVTGSAPWRTSFAGGLSFLVFRRVGVSLVEQGSQLLGSVTDRSGLLLQTFAVLSMFRRCARFMADLSSFLVIVSYSKLGLCGGVELNLSRSTPVGGLVLAAVVSVPYFASPAMVVCVLIALVPLDAGYVSFGCLSFGSSPCWRGSVGKASSSWWLGELLSLIVERLCIQGAWTEQRFPLSSFEVPEFWSYHLGAAIKCGLGAEVEGTGWRAIGSCERLCIQGAWTEQRFPLSSFEVPEFWSYHLGAAIKCGLGAEVEGTGWRAIGSCGIS
ncbi:hypothetical protein F2Q70_00006291 [Brassica cretica]|uniref:Uncharacterized protein n=1 Tax=Brassica cretica TaxID=69181 RepID=A0A8S9IYI1_BRACR|nr:hypothetical protein F2Q70_00006291 [Brassica cretica]